MLFASDLDAERFSISKSHSQPIRYTYKSIKSLSKVQIAVPRPNIESQRCQMTLETRCRTDFSHVSPWMAFLPSINGRQQFFQSLCPQVDDE